ncbi:hypothetical protein SCUCBS95973_009584 [Sporothrix curviconia]|uniref:Uncharacterized protein n=1 Tax=Sporothrix curviconia TaxID=1260050 RepID=A0ABP0CXU5_9PEZI
MQSDQGFGPQHQAHPDFLNTPQQQQQMATFMTSPGDLFGYPMSAPATATAFADARSFWAGGDPNMAAMDFTIDANGRARVETSVGEDDGPTPPSTLRRNQSARSLHSKSKWDSSSDDDSSSTDDEPIIIPSRTTSFALPDPVKPTIGRLPLHSSQRSVSDRSTTSSSATIPGDGLYNDPESEAETVMNDLPKGAGDAASELEKLRQIRQKRASFAGQGSGSAAANNLFGSVQRGLNFGAPLGGNVGYSGGNLSHHSMQAVSPTTLTEASLPTPSSATSQSHGIRCICGRPDAPPNSDGFIVQW